MSRPARQRALAGTLSLAFSLGAGSAGATDLFDFADQGTQQLGRGGAWVARANLPLATFYNPAGLAGQATGVSADVALVFNRVCFTRAGDGSKLDLGVNGVDYPGEVCNENGPQPLPAVAGVYRVMEQLGIGLSVAPPSLYGGMRFPETVKTKNSVGVEAELPSSVRYLLLESDGLFLNTTLAAGFEAVKGLRVGAGFIWGLGRYKLANANMSLSPSQQTDGSWRDPVTADVRAAIDVSDYFIPGVVVGVLASPMRQLDLGLTVTAQEAFDGHGSLETKANYWTNNGVAKNPVVGNSDDLEPNLAHFRLPNPLDVRVGARFHLPRDGAAPAERPVRDPLVDDVFDVEVDVSYTRNSAYSAAQLRFPQRPIIEVKGTGGEVPKNADVPFEVQGDTVGVRLGGDVVVLPGRLAVRAGGWYEPDVQRPEFLNVAFLASRRIGLALGAQVRLGPVDVEVAGSHVIFDDVDNGGNGRVRVISGDAAASPPYRSPYAINGGKITQSATIVSVGGTARF